jgi:hypothetical protein
LFAVHGVRFEIVGDLHLVCVARFQAEANAPLGVDADAVLAGAVALEASSRLLDGMRRVSKEP